MMKFCRILAKYSIFVVNLIISISGAILIIVGILDKIELNHFRSLIPEDYKNILFAPTFAILIGCIIFAVAFIGCLGAILEKATLLFVFAILLIVIFFMQVALGIFACVKVTDTESLVTSVEQSLTPIFDMYYTGEGHPSRDVVDLMQRELQCCGLKGPSYWTDKNSDIPQSCTDKRTKKPFKDGCSKNFCKLLHKGGQIIGITVLVLCAIEVLGSLYAYFLARSIRNMEY